MENVPYPRIEEFRADLSPDEARDGRASYARSVAMQSYLHGFPAFLHMRHLTEFIGARRYMHPGEEPLAGWILIRKLSDTTTNNAMPNVDTLYGAAFLLLHEQGPVVLSIPPVPDRYYSVAFLDAYFNNYATISPRTFGNDGGNFLIAPPGWSGDTPAGIRAVIISPTPITNLYQRIYARDAAEYPALHALQDAIRLTPLREFLGGAPGFGPVDLAPWEIQGMRETRDPLQFFGYANFYRGVNPPPPEDAGLMALFATARVGPGSVIPDDPELRDAIRLGARDAQAALNARVTAGPFRDGWLVPDPNTGRPGPHILSRAAIQLTQFGSFTMDEATYFFGYRDRDGEPLHGSKRYTLRFAAGELPPLRPHGFWSLTMYGANSLLVANPIDRYILRPNSPGLTYGADGSLTLWIQHARPDDAPEGNWLPAPQDTFVVALRAYQPQDAITRGKWFPPGLVAQPEP
jgi:hypothetical protein